MWKKKARREEKESKKGRKRQGRRNIEKTGTQKVLEVEESIWKKEVRKNTSTKDLGPYHRTERGVHTEKGKDILIVKGEKGTSTGIHGGSVEERIHLTFQVTSNITGTLCGKKGWHVKNGVELSIHKSVNDKEWVSFTPHHRHTGWSRKEESVYKVEPKVGIQQHQDQREKQVEGSIHNTYWSL